MPAISSIALGLAAYATVGALSASVYQGQQQKQAQRRAMRAQEASQARAESRAASEMRRQEMERRRLNKRKPDISALLGAERDKANTGAGSTTLTSFGGVGRNKLTLGQSSLLGG